MRIYKTTPLQCHTQEYSEYARERKMYVTRPMSLYQDDPDAAAEPPREDPGSGILVVQDKVAVQRATRWWGLWVDRQVYGLPFLQSRQLKVEYTTSIGAGRNRMTYTNRDDVMFVPVVGQPLSSCRYYVVRATGRHAGKVSACSREEDMTNCCFWSFVNDVPPRPFDRGDVYQQVEVVRLPRGRGFTAVAVAQDGIPPGYLRREGWKVHSSASMSYDLADAAQETDWPLRRLMLDLNSFDDVGAGGSPPVVVVGRWYCPFIFIKDSDEQLKHQVKRCMFYEMTLEQTWEEIYTCDNTYRSRRPSSTNNEIAVSATVHRSTALLGGTDAVQGGAPQMVEGVMWFRPAAPPTNSGAAGGVGLDMVVWEKMKWELERGGWVTGNDDVESIERVERREAPGQWNKFRCYLLLESFVLRRMDGSVALTCGFRHTSKIRTKWV